MKKSKMGLFLMLCQLSAAWAIAPGGGSTEMSNPLLTSVSRQCIKIWCLIRNLVENRVDQSVEALEKSDLSDVALAESEASAKEDIDHLDTLLCRVMKVRDTLSHCGTNPLSDTQTAEYIDSSLDCIGQYTYDLVERYPEQRSWGTIIQEQVFRTQEAYVQHLLPLLTK